MVMDTPINPLNYKCHTSMRANDDYSKHCSFATILETESQMNIIVTQLQGIKHCRQPSSAISTAVNRLSCLSHQKDLREHEHTRL